MFADADTFCLGRIAAEVRNELNLIAFLELIERRSDDVGLADFHQEIGNLEMKGLKIILDAVPESPWKYIPSQKP